MAKLTLVEIKEICPVIELVEQNTPSGIKLMCRDLMDDMCLRKEQFLCLVVAHNRGLKQSVPSNDFTQELATSPPPVTTPIQMVKEEPAPKTPIKTSVDHFSYSMIQSYTACPKAFWFEHIKKFPIAEVARWKIVGRAYHQALENYYRMKEGVMFEGTEIPAEDAKIRGIMEAYQEFYKDNTGGYLVEQWFPYNLHINERRFTGKIDMIKRETLTEHKTYSGDVQGFNLLSSIYQIALYLHAFPKATEVVMNVIRKPELKPHEATKKKVAAETMDEFKDRVRTTALKNPENYFRRIKYHQTEINVAGYINDLMWECEKIEEAIANDKFPRRPRSCLMLGCDYKQECIRTL